MIEPGKSRQRAPGRHSWLDDASSGVLALLLALAVWGVAIYQQDPPRVNDLDGIPIKYVNMRDDLVRVGTTDERVRVKLRASTSHWSSLGADDLEATVDLRGLDEGVHNVDVRVRSLDRLATPVQRTPARVVVRLEEKVTRQFIVQTDVPDDDSLPPGYVASPPRVSPERVTVSGARSLVESVTRVVATVWLRGSKTGFEGQVTPVAKDERGNPVDGVEMTPPRVTVRQGVDPLAEFRDVTVRAVVKGAPASGYWVSNITVEPPAVTVQGKPEVIRTMPAVVSTVPIDIGGVMESISKRVTLALPEGISVYSADTSGETVLVRVEVTAIVGGKTVQPKVEALGLRSNLKAEVSPDTVDVILSGPMPELQALQAEDVRVVVNLFGLSAGRHRITPTVLLPEGSNLKVERMAPDAVEVVITSTARGGL